MDYLYMILLAIAPGILLVLFIILQDRYDKEPIRLLVKMFVLGMIVTIPTLVVEVLAQQFNIFGGVFGLIFEAFIIIGLSEEFFKRFIVMRYAYSHPAFNERLDGIVYCSITALGFATLENIFYVVSYYTINPDIWITRAFLSVPDPYAARHHDGLLSLAWPKYSSDTRKSAGYYAQIPAYGSGCSASRRFRLYRWMTDVPRSFPSCCIPFVGFIFGSPRA